jgi:hypothetical protein
MSSIRAIVVDPEVPGRLAIKEVEAPQAGPSEALVQVETISLNRGEVLGAMEAQAAGDPVGIWPEPSSSKRLLGQGQRSEAGLRARLVQAHGLSRLRFLRTGWPKFPPA